MVTLAQRLLNRRLGSVMSVEESGEFSERMRLAIADLQAHERITTERDMIGPRTWATLGLRVNAMRQMTLVPQQEDEDCWAAAAAMALGLPSTMGVEDIVPPPGTDIGGFRTLRSAEMVASRFFWMAVPAPSSMAGLLGVAGGRAGWFAGTTDTGQPHAVAFAGAVGDGSDDATFMLVCDPLPRGLGSTYYTTYGRPFGTGAGLFTPAAFIVV
jgi:hypothetical protein